MPHREATWQDLLPASKVLAAGFKDSELFGQYMHPHRDQYSEDMYLTFLHVLRTDYYGGPDHRIIVTYSDLPNETGQVTGCAHWIRKRATKRSPGLYNALLSQAMTGYNYAESLLYPNRAADPAHLDVLDHMEPFTAFHWTGTRSESWYLSLIAVDPSAQGRGYGKELVKYGFEVAKAEGGVGCSVIAAPGRASFYEQCGFDVVVGTTSDYGGDDNPLRAIETATIHFWDNGVEPKGILKYGET